ncbi:ATPase AAA domain-containing protein 2 [Rhizophlyctis rosea]|nr:ATPase AAA domain-containing protein 2 [Rhizophlyctis rosea]
MPTREQHPRRSHMGQKRYRDETEEEENEESEELISPKKRRSSRIPISTRNTQYYAYESDGRSSASPVRSSRRTPNAYARSSLPLARNTSEGPITNGSSSHQYPTRRQTRNSLSREVEPDEIDLFAHESRELRSRGNKGKGVAHGEGRTGINGHLGNGNEVEFETFLDTKADDDQDMHDQSQVENGSAGDQEGAIDEEQTLTGHGDEDWEDMEVEDGDEDEDDEEKVMDVEEEGIEEEEYHGPRTRSRNQPQQRRPPRRPTRQSSRRPNGKRRTPSGRSRRGETVERSSSPIGNRLRERKHVDYRSQMILDDIMNMDDDAEKRRRLREERGEALVGAGTGMRKPTYGGAGSPGRGGEVAKVGKIPIVNRNRCEIMLEALDPAEREDVEAKLKWHMDNEDFGNVDAAVGIPKIEFGMIGGHEEHVKELQEMILLPLTYPEAVHGKVKNPPRGVLFYGPPGNGKTMMARALATSCSSPDRPVSFFFRNGADILSKYVGESEQQLKQVFDEAKTAQPSIIFFDEIDGLAPARSATREHHHTSLVTTLLTLMDGLEDRGQVVVIGATNRPDVLDPALMRDGRFDKKLEFKPPDEKARKVILDGGTREWRIDEGLKEEVARRCRGASGAQVQALCSEAWFNALRRTYPQLYEMGVKYVLDQAAIDAIRVTMADFELAIKKVINSTQAQLSNSGAALPSHYQPLLGNALTQATEFVTRVKGIMKQRDGKVGEVWTEPRLLITGGESMGQELVAGAVVNLLVEIGFTVETLEMEDGETGFYEAIKRKVARLSHSQPLACLFVPDLWEVFGERCGEGLGFLRKVVGKGARGNVLVVGVWMGEGGGEGGEEGFEGWFGGRGEAELIRKKGLRGVIRCGAINEDARKEFFNDVFLSLRKWRPWEVGRGASGVQGGEGGLAVVPRLEKAAPASVRSFTEAEIANVRSQAPKILTDLANKLRSIHRIFERSKYRRFLDPEFQRRYPGYYEAFERPIDLTQIQNNVEDHVYETPEDWLTDVYLMADQVAQWNEGGLELALKATELRDEAQELVNTRIPSHFMLNCLLCKLWRKMEARKEQETLEARERASAPSALREQRAARRAASRAAPLFGEGGEEGDGLVGSLGGKGKRKRRGSCVEVGEGVEEKRGRVEGGVPPLLHVETADSVHTNGGGNAASSGGPSTQSPVPPSPLSPVDAPMPAVHLQVLQAFEKRLLEYSEGMNVRDLGMVREGLVGVLEEKRGMGVSVEEVVGVMEGEL